MEFVQIQVVGAEVHQVIRRTRGRRGGAIQIRRQQAAYRRPLLEANLRGCGSGQHGGAVVGASIGPYKRGAAGKHVKGYVVSIGPHRHLRVVVEVAVLERIAIVGSSCVRGSRDRDALQVRRGGNGELAEDPALSQLVVDHDGVAVIVGLAAAAKSGPDSVSRSRSGNQSACGLVEDGE